MKTLTIEQFEQLITMPIWEHKAYTDIGSSDCKYSHGTFTAESTIGDITIYYRQGWSYTECNPYSFGLYDIDGGAWATEGFRVVDSDGDDLPGYEFLELLEDIPPAFSAYEDTREDFFEYEPLGSWQDGADLHYVEMHNRPSVKFAGECLGSVEADIYVSKSGEHIGHIGFWTEYELYKTTEGKYVCLTIHGSKHQGDQYQYRRGGIYDNLWRVYEFFGYEDLARELYELCGIEVRYER